MVKLFLVSLVLMIGVVTGFLSSKVFANVAEEFLMKSGIKHNRVERSLLKKLLELQYYAEDMMKSNQWEVSATADYPYWNILPQYLASLNSLSSKYEWSASCFQKNSAVFSQSEDGKLINIEIISSHPSSFTCSDLYTFASTVNLNYFEEIQATPESKTSPITTNIQIELPSDITNAEIWDLENKGIRLFQHLHDKKTILSNLLITMRMFVPEHTQRISKEASEMNIDFMNKYVGVKDIHVVNHTDLYIPLESEVKSGDPFYLRRLSGFGSLFSWAMGATTGHVTVALWIDGELYVVESASAGAAWPGDGVQRTPYRQWIKQRIEADWTVVWAPLNEEARKAYNETAAVEFFKSVEGYDYGFQNVIWGWLDTAKDNFPCLPPDFSSNCWQWEFLEPLLAYVDRDSPDIGDNIWNPGYNLRLGTTGLRTAELYQESAKQGKTPQDVIQIVEDDNWIYQTNRNGQPTTGPAMVCCVFVCDTWKAAGVFGALTDSINCAEATNWDDYVLTIHAEQYHQMIGEYSLDLNNYRSKVPYAHMAEHCPGLPIEYARPADC